MAWMTSVETETETVFPTLVIVGQFPPIVIIRNIDQCDGVVECRQSGKTKVDIGALACILSPALSSSPCSARLPIVNEKRSPLHVGSGPSAAKACYCS